MRVIAGSLRGRPLRVPSGQRTRPTSDRVREAIFDVLGSLVGPGGLAGGRVLDLFAGSGALGIEARSRGASAAVFVDDDRRALATVRRNLAELGLGEGSEVVQADALGWLAGPGSRQRFDLALCDPPYAFDDWDRLLRALPADMVVAESGRPVEVPAPWVVLKEKHYGGTLVTVAILSSTAAGAPGPSGPGNGPGGAHVGEQTRHRPRPDGPVASQKGVQ